MQFVDHQIEVKFRDLLWCLVIFFIAGFLWGKCLTNKDSYLYECLGITEEINVKVTEPCSSDEFI